MFAAAGMAMPQLRHACAPRTGVVNARRRGPGVNLPDSIEKPGIRVEVARAGVVGIAIRAFNLLTLSGGFINRCCGSQRR
jgi:hypothetical protein